MLMEVKNNLRFVLYAIKTSILSAMEYKVSFFTQAFFMFVNNGFFLIFWSIVLNINGGGDLVFDDILYIWSIPTIGFGVTYFFFDGVKNINTYILNGGLDSFLIQPKSVLLNVMTSKCDFAAFGDLVYGIVLGAIVSKGNILTFLAILLLGIISSVFYLSSEIMCRSLAVWFGNTEELARKYIQTLILNFSTYPEAIFGNVTKLLLYTVIPTAYVCYVPIRIITDFKFSYIVLLTFAIFVYLFIAINIFKKAISSYESGNNIAMKM